MQPERAADVAHKACGANAHVGRIAPKNQERREDSKNRARDDGQNGKLHRLLRPC